MCPPGSSASGGVRKECEEKEGCERREREGSSAGRPASVSSSRRAAFAGSVITEVRAPASGLPPFGRCASVLFSAGGGGTGTLLADWNPAKDGDATAPPSAKATAPIR